MKRTFLLLGIFVSLVGIPNVRGQSTLNVTGGTKTIGTDTYDWSIGELCMVSTFYGTDVIVTQGLLQNEVMIQAAVNNPKLTEHLQVFPNPASNLINLQFTSVSAGTLTYRLMDMTGKIITYESAEVQPGMMQRQVNISNLAAATYVLDVAYVSGGNEERTSYKIEKLK